MTTEPWHTKNPAPWPEGTCRCYSCVDKRATAAELRISALEAKVIALLWTIEQEKNVTYIDGIV